MTSEFNPVTIIGWSEYRKSTLRGFLSLRLNRMGLEIDGVTLHQKNEKRWVTLPARTYQDGNGRTRYAQIMTWIDPQMRRRFRSATLAAFDKYMSEGGHD